jgi:hypothetical protein
VSFYKRLATRRTEPAWTPARLPGLALWLSAADLSTITIATGVSEWRDKSGNGRHYSQGTGAAQPAWSAASVAVNGVGIPGVTFDGSDDFLTGSPFMYAANGCIAFLVATAPSIGTNDYVVAEGNSASNNSTYAIFKSSTSTATTVHSQILNDANTTILNNTPATTLGWQSTPQVLTRIDSGSNMAQRLNGVVGAAANYTRSGTMTLDLLTIGARSRATPVNHAPITIHELIVCTGTLSADDVQRAEAYCAWQVAPVALDTTGNGYWAYPP